MTGLANRVVGYSQKGKTWQYVKTLFCFIRADPFTNATATGKRCNLGDGEGLPVPCRLEIHRDGMTKNLVDILKKNVMSYIIIINL